MAAPKTRDEAIAETLKCQASFPYFLFTYCRISDDVKGSIPFEPWPYLVKVAESWARGESCVEGKGRQQGYSWALASYDIWILRFRKNARILSISIGERESKALLKKVKFVHDHLPSFLKLRLSIDNEEQFGFVKTGSSMIALPSTKSAGRGETATLVQTDEWAFHPYAGENFSAYRASIADGNRQHIAISTGNGPTGMFHDYFLDTKNHYIKRFNPWNARPDRDEAWYERERAAYLEDGKGAMLFIRENPSSINDMFTAVVGLVYETFKPDLHMRAPDFTYEDSLWRIASVDPGQGDPAAVSIIGESEAGHAHQFGVFRKEGATSAQDIYAYLKPWYEKAPLHAVVVDGAEGTLVATLNAWFERDFGRKPVVVANKERGIGLGLVNSRLTLNTFSIEPDAEWTKREFQSYRFSERRSPGEADPYTTSTPVDHHGDIMDTIRYALMYLSQYCSNANRKVVKQPDYRSAQKPAEKEVKPDREGAWTDPVAKRLASVRDITSQSSAKVPTRRSGSGPDYRARMRRMTGRR